MNESDELWLSYFYPNSDVLINNLGIHEQEKLKEAEATISFKKLVELKLNPLNMNFDKTHLLALHKYIFGDIYPFAGIYRKVNIRKERGSFLAVQNDADFEWQLDNLFNEVKKKLSSCYSKFDFAKVLAYVYTQLIYIHPFREGNGRTIREFVREFSIAKSKELGMEPMELNWLLINKEELNRYIDVSHVYPDATALLFEAALVPADKKKTFN